MARDEDDDDSLSPLAEGTDKFLEDAKKGKARSFLLVCKGTKVKYLAVRKKPVKKAELNEAKKLGYKGDGYFGVISGKGMELVFNLSIADGYTSAPVKDKILKDFLEEKADFKCKPTIAIVQTLPEIPFDDEDLSNPLVARFLGLAERISGVLTARPEVEAELRETVNEIRLLLQSGEFEVAAPRIDSLENRLQELASGSKESPAPQPSSPSAPPVPSSSPKSTEPEKSVDKDAMRAKLQEALNKLVPQLKQAVTDHPEKKVELLSPVAQIKKQLDAGELDEARKGILAVGQLLKALLTQTRSGNEALGQPADELRAQYENKLAALQPDYELALREMLGDSSKFRSVMAYVIEQAAASVYGNAIKAIDRLSQAVSQAVASRVSASDQPTDASAENPGDTEADPDGSPERSAVSEDEIRKRLAQIEPTYLSVLADNPTERTRIMASMSLAIELNDEGEFDRASITLDRLEQLLANPGQPDQKPKVKKTEEPYSNVIGGEGQLVKYRKALLAWDSAKKSATSQLAGLKSAIADKAPALASSTDILDRVMDQLNDELADAINAAINADEMVLRIRAHERAGELARNYMVTVNFHPAFEAVDRNVVQPLKLRSTLSAGLAQVVAALPL